MGKYARTGPPFNYLGHFSESQKKVFKEWAESRTENFSAIQEHHQIRAQQLRKTAGLLEQFYAVHNDEELEPTFEKDPWAPAADGHFGYAYKDDHLPMLQMSKVKRHFQAQLERHDEAVFEMNRIRNLIEKTEDFAQHANDAPDAVAAALKKIDDYFTQPQYQAVLVRDLTELDENGEPYYRTNPWDPPTSWEKKLHNHGNGPIQLKEPKAK